MTIPEAREKCKILIGKVPRDTLIVTILVLASSCSFGLGYLAGLDEGEAQNTPFEACPVVATSENSAEPSHTGQVVASKSGTKYYLPSCAGADRISEANKVWFVSPAAAVAAGYAPAVNCKGL